VRATRATEQSGVRSGRSSIGWALVFAVLTALAVQLSVLTASASADGLSLVEATQDEAVAAPVAGDDGTTSESPAADPVPDPVPDPAPEPAPDPKVTSPEPAARSGSPATVESSEPDTEDPALPPSAEVDRPDVTHAGAPTGPAESSPATTHQIESTTPAVPEPLAPLPPAAGPTFTPVPLPVAPESPARLRGAAPKRSRASMGVATIAWGQPGSLVSGVTAHAWAAVVKWRPPPVSLPAPRANSPADPTTENLVRQTPPERLPPVPRAPSSAMCGGASSCGAVAMLPLFMGIVCLCASLFQRLSEAPTVWRPTRFLNLRERPG
jgi:hypothetical protein